MPHVVRLWPPDYAELDDRPIPYDVARALFDSHLSHGRPEDLRATWQDIQREALHCPVLQALVTVVEAGHVSREDGLLSIALWMSRDRRRLLERETHRLMHEVLR